MSSNSLRRYTLVAGLMVISFVLTACGGGAKPGACAPETLKAPSLIAPMDFSVVSELAPSLTWSYSGTCAPSSYKVEIAPDSTFANVSLGGSAAGTANTFVPGTPLAPGHEYWWRVAAVSGTNTGPYSSPMRLYTGPLCDAAALTAPNLESPGDGAPVSENRPTLQWSYPSAGCLPPTYRVDLSTDSTFADTSLERNWQSFDATHSGQRPGRLHHILLARGRRCRFDPRAVLSHPQLRHQLHRCLRHGRRGSFRFGPAVPRPVCCARRLSRHATRWLHRVARRRLCGQRHLRTR
jgi:hypothetical protein